MANLAQLALTDQEKELFREQLSSILDYARRLQQLDTSDIAPTVSAIIRHIEAQGDAIIDLRVERPSLEDRFLEITRSSEGAPASHKGGQPR